MANFRSDAQRKAVMAKYKTVSRGRKRLRVYPQKRTGSLMNLNTGQFDKGRGIEGDNIPAGYMLILDNTELAVGKKSLTEGRLEGKSGRRIRGRRG